MVSPKNDSNIDIGYHLIELTLGYQKSFHSNWTIPRRHTNNNYTKFLPCRKEILILEYHLLQNTVDYQKHLAAIKEWEQRHNLPTSLSTLSTTANSQEHKDTINKEAHKPRELRNEEQFNNAYVESSEPTSSNEQSEPLYSRPAEDNNVKSINRKVKIMAISTAT